MTNIEGTFDFVEMESERRMYIAAYNLITRLEKWNTIRSIDPGDRGYMFSGNPVLNDIMTHIDNDYGSHSACSLAVTMRVMEYIAKFGYGDYKELYLKG